MKLKGAKVKTKGDKFSQSKQLVHETPCLLKF